MVKRSKRAPTSTEGIRDKPLSLAPLDFETAVRAAMATGKLPKPKSKKAAKTKRSTRKAISDT